MKINIDSTGNKVLKIESSDVAGARGFSIQTNGNLPKTRAYLAEAGTDYQRELFGVKKKITLATLPQASAQEVFDQVATHLLTQGEQSKDFTGGCAYRGRRNLMCAAGCLISDKEYRELNFKVHEIDKARNGIEDISWNVLAGLSNPDHHELDLIFNARLITSAHAGLIVELQKIHDGSSCFQWAERLTALAARYFLSADCVKKATAKNQAKSA